MMSSDRTSRTATGTTTPAGSQDQLWRNRSRRPSPEVPEYTVTDAVAILRHTSSATGTSHSTRARARSASGTVPTVVTRPSPCAAVTTVGQVPTNGCSYSTITSAPATTRLSAHPVAWVPDGGSRAPSTNLTGTGPARLVNSW